jgi:hypothetical protein
LHTRLVALLYAVYAPIVNDYLLLCCSPLPPPRVLMEEYGTGRYSRKHSTFYKAMMEELGLNTSERAAADSPVVCVCGGGGGFCRCLTCLHVCMRE